MDLSEFVLIWSLSLQTPDSTILTMLRVHAITAILCLHGGSMLRLWLLVSNAHLLKEDIGSIEDRTGIACSSTSLSQEVVQNLGLDLLAIGVCLCNLAEEAGLSDTWLAEVGVDLLADLVTGLEHRDRLILFTFKMNARDVVLGSFFCRLRLLLGKLDTLQFALLEELESMVVYIRSTALIWSILTHESTVCIARAANGTLEFGNLHLARVEEISNEGADLIAVLVDSVQAVIIAVYLFDCFDLAGLAFG